ncbi:MAG: RNA polymerase subunit sigma-24 [Actinomycetales bacterium]|uniref:RNA polymerase subunit sigma-24 n=1 Tax=Candidatus Phosphoribacter hodrii TaxID=2953743 RepID=A0A935IHK2_9MICO|nr:RNA polymerase subunit sigma-24 [Candidatus Phosphoribacter hodrii]
MSKTIERVWRDEWGRLLALLVGQFRRLDLAEDALADAFEAAARTWPRDGIPANPPAWLLTAARRRAVDRLRAEAVAARKEPLLVVDARTQEEAQRAMADPGDQPGALADERLRLVFLCAHPALAPEAAAALTLRLVMGVSTADLARLFLVAEPTMAARLTRARKKLAVAGVAFALPTPERLAERIDVVATVAYLAFTAGYAPGSGPDVVRAELAGEAIRLTRLLRQLLQGYAVQPPSAATQSAPLLDALLALMLLQHSRREARVDDAGRLVLLPDQDRGRWKRGEIADALGLLAGLPDNPAVLGRRATEVRLQALIAAEHAVALRAGDTDWRRIADRYAALDRLTASPVVRLNRAVAVAEADGPEAGLALLDGLDEVMPTSHRVSTVRAELLVRAGRAEEAAAAYERAIGLCTNEAERAHLLGRREALGRDPGRP